MIYYSKLQAGTGREDAHTIINLKTGNGIAYIFSEGVLLMLLNHLERKIIQYVLGPPR
jgi:hypothetical protein